MPQQKILETSIMGDKDMGTGGQGHFGADSRLRMGVDSFSRAVRSMELF